MKFKLRTTSLLIFFYLLGSFASVSHVHKDATTTHIDCKICMLVNAMHGANAATETLATGLNYKELLSRDTLILLYIRPLLKGYNAQAPPLLLS